MVKTFELTINAEVKVSGGFLATGVHIDGYISASDLSHDDYDIIGFTASPYKSKTDKDAGEPSVEVEGLNKVITSPVTGKTDKSFNASYKSTDFDYTIEQDTTTKKSGLSSVSMDSFKEKVKESIAAALSIQVTDIV